MQFMLRMAFISWMKNVERNASFCISNVSCVQS